VSHQDAGPNGPYHLHRGQPGDIYKTLRDRICFLRYPPGYKLAENELAEEFSVSRTPIRQALQRLEYDGLTEIRNGVGTTVRQADRAAFDDIFALRLRLSELLGDFPATDEVPAALAVVKNLLEPAKQAKAEGNKADFWGVNHQLQHATSRLIANHALRETHERYYFQACRIWYSVIDDIFDEQSSDFIIEVTDIARALEQGDVRAVGYIQRNHISYGMRRIVEFSDRHPTLSPTP
jgi:DNA-binding GntR family transcriptional regulator